MATAARMIKTATVYVVQEDSRKNITQAMDFGNVEALLQEREEATMLNIPAIVQKIRYGLRHMTSQDYLLLIGNPVSIGIACAIASEMCGGQFNVLKWDGQEMRYWKAKVNIFQND